MTASVEMDQSTSQLSMKEPQSAIESPMEAADDATTPSYPEFSPKTCLFCNRTFGTPSANCYHMSSKHGLQIPEEQSLLVDRDTLLGYLHLVIYEFHECLWCHTTRSSSRAIQQHMITQDHCQANFEAEGGEYGEFFRSDSEAESEEGSNYGDDQGSSEDIIVTTSNVISGPDIGTGDTLRLPSGKTIMNKNAEVRRTDHHHRLSTARFSNERPARRLALPDSTQEAADTLETTTFVDTETPTSKALSKQERRSMRLATQVAGVRASDRTALAHLLPAEKRALLAGAQKQEARAGREEQHFRTKMDKLGNTKAKERFVNDVPGGKSHKNRFMAT